MEQDSNAPIVDEDLVLTLLSSSQRGATPNSVLSKYIHELVVFIWYVLCEVSHVRSLPYFK